MATSHRFAPTLIQIVTLMVLSLFFSGALGQQAVNADIDRMSNDGFDHQVWDALLNRFVFQVRDGANTEVDYAGFLRERTTLKRYLDQLGAVTEPQFLRWPANEQLAFLINAYNAWTVELILTRYPDLESIKELGSFFRSPWARNFIPLLGKTRSLDDIEHSLIRGSGRYNDPRIHFAVNCASIGCPALRAEAYTGEDLDAQLEEQTRRFLSDKTRNRIERGNIALSSIFEWYRDDFETDWRATHSLHGFLLRYAEAMGLDSSTKSRLQYAEMPLKFLDYDWRLNVRR